MKQKCLYLASLIAAAFCGLGLRFWNLTSGTDAQGLPVPNDISVWMLVICSGLFLVVFLVLSICAPAQRAGTEVLRYGKALTVLSYGGAALLLFSAGHSFGSALKTGADLFSPLLLILGIVSGFCMLGVASLRGAGKKPAPPAELIPTVYLIIKLVFDFRNWSTDPMILDYFPSLFALIFVVLAYYYSAGFAFSQGKPRRTLFYAMAAIYFSMVSAADGIFSGDWPAILEHVSFILWLLPVVWRLLTPVTAETPPEQIDASTSDAAENEAVE